MFLLYLVISRGANKGPSFQQHPSTSQYSIPLTTVFGSNCCLTIKELAMSIFTKSPTEKVSQRGRHSAAPIPYGQRFNHALVLGGAPAHRDGHQQVLCLCDCGNMKPFTAKLSKIKSGKTKSCGHLKGRNFVEYWKRKAAALEMNKVRAIFNAVAANKYSEKAFKAVAKSFKVNIAIIRPAIERCKLWLVETYGEQFTIRFNPGFGPDDKISIHERQYLRLAVTLKMLATEPLEIDWNDFEIEQQEKFLMSYSFEYSEAA